MCQVFADAFKRSDIKEIIKTVMLDNLQGKQYNSMDAKKWSKQISDAVSVAVKELNMVRYNHIVQVTLGQQLGAGCNYIAKCCWDAATDTYASDIFSNESLFCICTVFGIYRY